MEQLDKTKLYFEYTMANDLMSYNKRWNMVVSSRSYGKTYWFLKRAIKLWIKNKEHFIYLRRTVVEIDSKHVSGLFVKVMRDEELQDKVMCKVDGNKCLITLDIDLPEKERQYHVFGYIIALSQAPTFKSIDFPDVTNIVYEEFLIEEYGGRRYLPNEPQKLKDFYVTVARERTNVRVYLLANAISMNNPFFNYWGLYPYSNQKEFYVNKDILLCFPTVSAEEHKEYMLSISDDDAEYNEYAFANGFLRDNDNFIEKKSETARYVCTLIYNEEKFGLWQDFVYGLMYLTNKVDPSCKQMYSFTTKDHRPNLILVNNINKFPRIKLLKEHYLLGCVRFENMHVKSVMCECFKWL